MERVLRVQRRGRGGCGAGCPYFPKREFPILFRRDWKGYGAGIGRDAAEGLEGVRRKNRGGFVGTCAAGAVQGLEGVRGNVCDGCGAGVAAGAAHGVPISRRGISLPYFVGIGRNTAQGLEGVRRNDWKRCGGTSATIPPKTIYPFPRNKHTHFPERDITISPK